MRKIVGTGIAMHMYLALVDKPGLDDELVLLKKRMPSMYVSLPLIE